VASSRSGMKLAHSCRDGCKGAAFWASAVGRCGTESSRHPNPRFLAQLFPSALLATVRGGDYCGGCSPFASRSNKIATGRSDWTNVGAFTSACEVLQKNEYLCTHSAKRSISQLRRQVSEFECRFLSRRQRRETFLRAFAMPREKADGAHTDGVGRRRS
jgi:hypothetical protein